MRAARIAGAADLAWALCAPEGARPALVAWDPRSSSVAWRFELAAAAVFDVARDGLALAVADAAGWCALLDAARGVVIAEFRDAPGEPEAVALAGGRCLVVRAGRARLWDAPAARALADVPGHAPAALAPDGRSFAVADRARAALTVHDDVGAVVRSLRAPTGATFTAVDLGPSGALAVGHSDGSAAVRDAEARALPRPTRAAVTAVRVRDDGLAAATGHADGAVRVHDLAASPSPSRELGGAGAVDAIAPSLRAALHREPRAAVLVELDTAARFDPRSGHLDAVTSIAVSRDGRAALTASRDGTLRLWEAATGATLQAFEGHRGAVLSAALSPDGLRAWSSGERDGLRAWDLRGGEEVTAREGERAGLRGLVASPTGDRLLAVAPSARGRGCFALLLDAGDGAALARGSLGGAAPGAVAFDGGGRAALLDALPLDEGGVRLLRVDARTGEPAGAVDLRARPREARRARACVLHRASVDGAIVTADTDRAELTWWDAASGEALGRSPHGGDLLSRPLVAAGRRYVAAASGRRLDLCDVASGARSSLRLPDDDAATALALAPDERWLLVGTAQGLVLRYALG